MSHPFTLDYMQEGEISTKEISGEKRKKSQKGSAPHRRQIKSRQSSRVYESESVAEECQTDLVEENPDGGMEMIKKEMNITITDKEHLSFLKISRMIMKRRMEIFAEEVSIVGLSYLFKPSNYKIGLVIRKVVWTMLLLFGTGFMAFQIYDRISYYRTYPTIVNYRVAYNQSLRFPTVSICSQILGRKEAVLSLGNKIYFHLRSFSLFEIFCLSSSSCRDFTFKYIVTCWQTNHASDSHFGVTVRALYIIINK